MNFTSKTNWNLYRCFVATYEAGGYSQAVKLIDVARNNIKANVDTLCRQLGVELFISNSKGAKPTSAAVKIYPAIKRAIELILKEEDNLKDFTNETEAIIRMIVAMVGTCLAELFKDFRKKYPKIIFEFKTPPQEDYNEFILGNVDFVIDTDEKCKFHGLKSVDLLTVNLVLIASKSYLTEKGLSQTISKNELQNQSIIIQKINDKSLIDEIGSETILYMDSPDFDPTYAQVKLGNGIGIYPREYLENNNNDIVELKIAGVENMPEIKYVCVYQTKTLSKAAQAFIDALLKFCAGRFVP